jgi:hypothetical protein
MKRMVCIGFILLLFIRYASQVQSATQISSNARDNVVAEAKRGGYQLISPEELKEDYLKDPATFSLVDVRQEWSYQMQHIKGALHIDFAPTWWNQYSPMMRSEMKKLLGTDKGKKFVFY